jgi:hypothetical protein
MGDPASDAGHFRAELDEPKKSGRSGSSTKSMASRP